MLMIKRHAKNGSQPRRRALGPGFARLWTATAVSTLGDGIYFSALPLLAATLTTDPFTISAVFFAGQLPWLLFSLISGAVVDRVDRRKLMWRVDAVRCAIVAVLGILVLAGVATIPVLMACGFLLGIGQTFYDNSSQAFVPALVSQDRERLERANGQLNSTMLLGEQLAGPPLGGVLFTVVRAVPFLADAASFAFSAIMVGAIRGRFRPQPAPGGEHASIRTEIAQGLAWLWHHRLLRALASLVALMNLVSAACLAILVLFAKEQLGLSSIGYSLLLTGFAAGGAVAGLTTSKLGKVVGTGPLLIAVIAGDGIVTICVGAGSNVWVSASLLIALGYLAVVWNVVTVSLRQQIVPAHLFGRVNSVYRMLAMGTMPIGALTGGSLAGALGLRAPFLIGGTVILIAAVISLRAVNSRAVRRAEAAAADAQMARNDEPLVAS